IELSQRRFRRIHRALSDGGRRMQYLPLQVRQLDLVRVDDAESADTGSREVESRRRAQAARTDDEHFGLTEPYLRFATEIRHHDLAAITLDLVGCESNAHGLSPKKTSSYPKKT